VSNSPEFKHPVELLTIQLVRAPLLQAAQSSSTMTALQVQTENTNSIIFQFQKTQNKRLHIRSQQTLHPTGFTIHTPKTIRQVFEASKSSEHSGPGFELI
jgi:hypothetical protein